MGVILEWQRVFNHLLYAAKYKIPFECFFNEGYSLEVFNMLEKLNEDYKGSTEDIFSNMINNIVHPSNSVLKYKELGYKDLIKADAKVVRQVYNVFYKSHDFRGKEVKLIEKKEGSVEVKKYLYDLTGGANVYSMTAPLTAPHYDF